MSRVVSVIEQVAEPGSTSKGVTTLTRVFIVQLDKPDPGGPDIALNANSIPKEGDAYPNEVAGRFAPVVVSKTVSSLDEKNATQFKVVVTYNNEYAIDSGSNSGGGSSPPDPKLPPWMLPAKLSFDFTEYPVTLEYDWSETRKPVVNTLGEPFDPAITTTLAGTRIAISKASLFYSPFMARDYIGRQNSEEMSVGDIYIGAGEAKVTKYSATTNIYTDEKGVQTQYYDVQIEIMLAPSGMWAKEVLNRGYKEMVDGKVVRAKIEGSDDYEPMPVLLNEDGTRVDKNTGTPHTLIFETCQSRSMASLLAF